MTTSAPRADPPVHQHGRVVADRLAHLDERVERGDRAVDLAPAVVRDDDPVDPVLEREHRVLAREHALDEHRQRRPARAASARSSHVSARFGNVASACSEAATTSSSGGLLQPRAEDRVAEELRAALALEERQVGVAQVARRASRGQRVERDDDRAVAGRLRPPDEALADLVGRLTQ